MKPPEFHDHDCETCRYRWVCLMGVRCQVAKAAQANRIGPFCDLCLHVEMAKRYAAHRQVKLRVNWPPKKVNLARRGSSAPKIALDA